MSERTEPGTLGDQIPLYEHAVRLHRLHPDGPLPGDGEPYPDKQHHRSQECPATEPDYRRRGMEAAAVLDAHFARPDAPPSDLTWAFHEVDVPIHRNEHITAAALRADRKRVRKTGRWLVRHSPDRCSVLIGLALLAAEWKDEGESESIRTIGLLSDTFAPLAADALKRRRDGQSDLLWLAERAGGWGRVYVVEALCQRGGADVRRWLLRRACDGDFLNGYFVGEVATATHLHAAIIAADADDELIDHTGRLLSIMTISGGIGTTWGRYPPARGVLEAHAGHLARQEPTLGRYTVAAHIAEHLAKKGTDELGFAPAMLLDRYLAVLRRPEWAAAAEDGEYTAWFNANIAPRRGPTGPESR